MTTVAAASALRVQIEGISPSFDWYAVPVALQIMDERFRTVVEATLRGEEIYDLPAGVYLVQARLPSGETLSATAVATANETTPVTLRASESPHEWLAWQHFLGESPAQSDGPDLASLGPLWLRLWIYSGGGWTVDKEAPWADWQPTSEQAAIAELNAARLPMTLLVVQAGGARVRSRFVALPPTQEDVQVLLRPARVPSSLNDGLAVKIVSASIREETMAHYLNSGSIEAARAVGPDLLEDAEEMLRAKMAQPRGAAIGGYFLLRVGDYQRLHNWPNNFANWNDWLADAAILHATQILRTGAEDELPQARARLLEAVQRGLPVYTYGLRLLVDGLELVAEEARAEQGSDEEVAQALRYARRYASAVDWSQSLTTFTGARPDEPSVTPAYVELEDMAGVLRIGG